LSVVLQNIGPTLGVTSIR